MLANILYLERKVCKAPGKWFKKYEWCKIACIINLAQTFIELFNSYSL